jgi:hypothetical protein
MSRKCPCGSGKNGKIAVKKKARRVDMTGRLGGYKYLVDPTLEAVMLIGLFISPRSKTSNEQTEKINGWG